MEEFYFYTKGLTVGYHGVPLIKDIELSVKKGEILTLIGPNGAGKTTILKNIIRQLKPLGGVAVLDGSNMEELSGRELSKKLSVVLTERVRPEMMNCRDVVSTGRYPYTGKFGVLSEEDWKIVDESMRLIHAFLTGLIGFICAELPLRIGFNFSAGLLDYLLCLNAPMTENPWLLWPVGIFSGILYYVLFRFCIQKFRLHTPGREEPEKTKSSI